MAKPTVKDIKKFLEIFDKLCKFEASQRIIRGYGCFSEAEIPFKEVVKVISWLKSKAAVKDKDIIDNLIVKYEQKAEDLRVESASAQAKNDYISYSTLNEEAVVYEDVIEDLRSVGGLGRLKSR